MASVIVPVLLLTALVTWLGPENKEAELGRVTAASAARAAAAASSPRSAPSG